MASMGHGPWAVRKLRGVKAVPACLGDELEIKHSNRDSRDCCSENVHCSAAETCPSHSTAQGDALDFCA